MRALKSSLHLGSNTTPSLFFGLATLFQPQKSNDKPELDWLITTLEQACPSEYQRAQYAFKDSMTH
jgi:hypothetical protein